MPEPASPTKRVDPHSALVLIRRMLTEYGLVRWKRYALAFAPIALTLVGIPLALNLKKGSKAFGFGITFLIVFVYYVF